MTQQKVQFGLFLTNQHLIGTDQVRALHDQIRLVHAARDNGWDMLWAGQHFLAEGMTHIQPIPYLARLATETGTMRVGIGINLLSLANPVEVAENYAALDVVLEGRLIYGVGLGYRQEEYEAFGLSKKGQVHRLEENLRIVTELWSGAAVDADLPWCKLRGATLTFLPVQRPRPEIWMAANSDGAVERAARLTDTWMINPHATTDTVRRQIEVFNTAACAAGRNSVSTLPLMREVFCAPTREEAVRLAAPYLSAKYKLYASWGQDKVMPDKDDFAAAYESLASERFVVGSPEDVIAELTPWLSVGVNQFIIRTNWIGMPVQSAMQSIQLLSDHVLPALKG
jgi:alkanesulfonate monooxygenase SsuD/methylene tetrahydromethanopterin reductase-like flavin-dependent oxidoreductase (luciferase family)